jgi:hypothetical protein
MLEATVTSVQRLFRGCQWPSGQSIGASRGAPESGCHPQDDPYSNERVRAGRYAVRTLTGGVRQPLASENTGQGLTCSRAKPPAPDRES